MKKLIILSGPSSCGKTTLVKELGLENNTLSPDILRVMFSGTEIAVSGNIGISQRDNYKVFKELFNILETRMQYGLLTVIDAPHTTERDMDKYKYLSTKYGYEVILVDFQVSLETLLERNANRTFGRVQESVIERMYNEKKNAKIPAYIRKITPDRLSDELKIKYINLDKYKAVYHIGDIHGCATALKEAIPHIDYNAFYIFHGDYINKGLENVEVLKYLLPIMKRPNVILLKGNHEQNLVRYANNEDTYGKAFSKTRAEIEESSITLRDLKMLTSSFKNYYAYSYKGKKFFCTHGGISHLEGIALASENEFIVGSGATDTDIDAVWDKNVSGVIQIHGHRNPNNLPIAAATNSYNLEGEVEKGGHLRMLTVLPKSISGREIKNNVYAQVIEESPEDNE